MKKIVTIAVMQLHNQRLQLSKCVVEWRRLSDEMAMSTSRLNANMSSASRKLKADVNIRRVGAGA